MATEEKGPGRGRGRFTAAGSIADIEARVTALEDFLSDQIDEGNVTEPVIEEPTEEPTEG